MNIEEAIQYFNDEIRLCRAAPSINGCQMTENWQRTIDACEIAVSAIRKVQELEQAEQDGRLVVLPCKVGDTVFRVFTVGTREPVIKEVVIKTVGEAADLIGRIWKKNMLVSVFRTREEAEAALAGKGGDG